MLMVFGLLVAIAPVAIVLVLSLLAIVLRAFTTRESDRRLVEIVLTRLPGPPGTKLAASGVRWESSSWT